MMTFCLSGHREITSSSFVPKEILMNLNVFGEFQTYFLRLPVEALFVDRFVKERPSEKSVNINHVDAEI